MSTTTTDITITITKDGAPGEYAWEVAVGMHRELQDRAFAMERSTADAFVRWGSLLIQIKNSLEKKGQPWLKFLETASNIKRAQKAMRLAAVAAGQDGSLDVARTKGAIVTFNQDARDRGVRPLSTDTISRRSAEIAFGIRGGDPLHGPARDHGKMSDGPNRTMRTASKPVHAADDFEALTGNDPDVGAMPEMSDEEMAESDRRQVELDRMGEDEDFDFDVDAEPDADVEDGDDGAHESDGGAAAGLSSSTVGAGGSTLTTGTAATTTATSSTADDAGPAHREVSGSGVVGFVGTKGLGAEGQGLVGQKKSTLTQAQQMSLESLYAEAERVRMVADRIQRGTVSEAMRKRLSELLDQIERE